MNKLKEQCRELLGDESKAMFADGFEEAIMGISHSFSNEHVICYNMDKCIDILMQRDGMTLEEAVEFFEFNTLGSYVGEGTPVYVKIIT